MAVTRSSLRSTTPPREYHRRVHRLIVALGESWWTTLEAPRMSERGQVPLHVEVSSSETGKAKCVDQGRDKITVPKATGWMSHYQRSAEQNA